jgi:tetratricopeptide (TPR) repeat protein
MGASYEDVKVAYRRLARRYHPDANPTNQQQAKEKFIQITEAYRRLTSVIQPSRSAVRQSASASSSSPPVTSPPPAPSPAPSAPAPPLQKKPSIHVTPDLSAIDCELKQESYEQLQQLLREQRFPRAVTLIEGLAHRLPKDIEVRQWQAITYQRFARYLVSLKQAEKAKRYLQKALRVDPHNRSLSQEIARDLQQIQQVESR